MDIFAKFFGEKEVNPGNKGSVQFSSLTQVRDAPLGVR